MFRLKLKVLNLWSVAAFVFILLMVYCTLSYAEEASKGIGVYVFVNDECDECRGIVADYVLPFMKSGDLNAIELNTEEADKFELLLAVEKHFGLSEKDTIPSVLFHDELIGKEAIIAGALKDKIKESAKTPSLPFFDFSKLQTSLSVRAPEFKLKPTQAVYFYQEGCKKCSRAERSLRHLQLKYHELSIKKFDIADPKACLFYEYLAQKYNIPKESILKTPAVFMSKDYLTEKGLYYLNMEKVVLKYRFKEIVSGYDDFLKKGAKGFEQQLTERFKKFKIGAILAAGLIDGINPCAFATMIFFVTTLVAIRKSRKIVIGVGLTFISAVFLTYFAVGIGGTALLQEVLKLSVIQQVVTGIYRLMALILVLFAVISLRDIWAFLKSGKQNVWLKLSDERSERIRKFLRINLRLPHYLGAAAVSGIFVSLTELACTGQVYLPTIMFILQVPALKQRAMLFLCLYNLAFILPLVVVFLMALTGVQAIKFNQISRKDFIIGKILLAVFFLIFAVFLWGR